MPIDSYLERTLKSIKEAKSDEELTAIINKIYDDGFSDGGNFKDPDGEE